MVKKKVAKPQLRPEKGIHCVVKRTSGECELYDERKVYGSTYAACYVVRMHEKSCEKIADIVAKSVTKLLRRKKVVHAHHITKHVVKELRKHSKHAAFMYETHKDIG